VYQLASGDPAKPILVDWTVLGWALPADAGDTLPALAAEVVPESTPEAVQVPQAHATLQGTATIKEGRSDSREAFPRLLLTIPAGVSADQVWYRAVLRASARTTGPGGGLAMRLGNSVHAPLPAETAGAVAVLGAFTRCEARACTVILQPIFLRTTDDRDVADVAWTLDVDLVALDGDPSVVDAGWDVRLEAYP
jgi:hypothetical protein